ncbi:hypothetical protein [Nocardioides bizhenqiangii]|uniref:Uncharacterized protein n=1 Tax=Nocardioides bizhenqiangii TaxID=3095076 RepID=A0ABZ0ZRF8_9ACTN|nr:hypothetical protein [Nocardioides sp. HM61]WQQ26823.1 hypothetical protein SHK19_00990 [Nocardioides sp. HM61]
MSLVAARDLTAPVTVVLTLPWRSAPITLHAISVRVDPDDRVLLVGEGGRGLVALDGGELVLTVEADR